MSIPVRASLCVAAVALSAAVLVAPPAAARPYDPSPATVAAAPPGAETIPGSYIVTLRDTAPGLRRAPAAGNPPSRDVAFRAAVATAANDLVTSHGGAVRHVYGTALTGFAVRMSATQAARLAADPRVARVEPDTIVRLNETTQPDAPWNLDRVDQRGLPLSTTYTYPFTATGVNVYVLDTGIRISHREFGGRARHAYDFVDNDANADDCHGHGTHVAGTVGGVAYGAAKGVTLHALRVLGCDGNGANSGVIAAVNWVTANAVKPAVANMSLGDVVTPAMDEAVRTSIASGVVYTLAAGNDGGDACGHSPARVAEAITVGNSTSSDARRSDSNYGTCVDLFAPGTSVVSAGHRSDTGTATMTGTSMAAPLVAGAAAMYLAADPAATPHQVSDALAGCATTGVVTNAGAVSPNRLLFMPCGTTTPPQTFENTTDLAIPDWSVVHSSITVSGRTGNAPSALVVAVKVVHPYRGDLALDLLAPDGTVYPLKAAEISDLADNLDTRYVVDASAEPASGVWQLRVRDSFGFDTGYLDQWSLTF